MEEKKKNTTKKNSSTVKKNTNNKKTNNNSSVSKTKKKDDNKKVDKDFLEKTNVLDIVIDDKRLKDKESLDFSFIDGKKKKRKAQEEIEILDEVDYKEAAKKIDVSVDKKMNTEWVSTMLIIIFSFVLGVLLCYIWASQSEHFKVVEKVKDTVVEEKNVVDENIVFVGDSLIKRYDLKKYYSGMKVVNSGVSGDKTTDLLSDLEERIYRYNPSKVIILIGTNDYNSRSNEEIVENIGKIVDEIKKNRKYADIYVQSLYPVNKKVNNGETVRSRNNEDIKNINLLLEKMCKDKKVEFMNIFEFLVDEEGNLSKNYTEDGLHINSDAYKMVTREILDLIK